MDKERKKLMLNELHEKFNRSTVAILSEFNEMNVEEMAGIRKEIRSIKGELRVVKNRIAKKAVAETSLSKAADYFKGPIVVALGYDEPVALTKIIKQFCEKNKTKLKIKVGVVEGTLVNESDIKKISELPGRTELISMSLSRIQAPLYNLAGNLNGIMNKLVYALNSVKDKKAATT